MCLIIDTCAFSSVFDSQSKNHSKYIPVIEWLVSGKGKIVIGGSKYYKELKGAGVTAILANFERRGKVVKVDGKEVDRVAATLKARVPDPAFNDEHLVALVSVSKCRVVCTDDKKSVPFFKRKDLYPRGMKCPKIYGSARNAKLCCNKHIVGVCC